MLKELFAKAEAASFKARVKTTGLACPSCHERSSLNPPSGNEILTCNYCGTSASALEWSSAGSGGLLVGHPDRPPSTTAITRGTDETGAAIWEIPASGKSGGMLPFAIFWCAITALVSGGFLFAFLSGESPEGNFPEWAMIPFFGLFWAVGAGIFYAAVRNKYSSHRITIDGDSVTLGRQLFSRLTNQTLPFASIRSVSQVEFYEQNERSVSGIQILGETGKIKFGSILSNEEKAWLVADLQRAILKKSPAAASPRAAPAMQPYFTVTLPKSTQHLWPIAWVLLFISIFGIAFVSTNLVGGTTAGDHDSFQRFFDQVTSGFPRMFLFADMMMGIAAIGLLAWLFSTRDREIRLEGDATEIAIRTYKHGLVLAQKVFPRSSVLDIRASLSGNVNAKPMKRIELLLVPGKAEMIARWIDGEKADALVTEVRSALGHASLESAHARG